MGLGKAIGNFLAIFNRKDKRRIEKKEGEKNAEPEDIIKKCYLGMGFSAFFKRRRLRVFREKNKSE